MSPRAQPRPSAHERLRRAKLEASRLRAEQTRRGFLALLASQSLPAATTEHMFVHPLRKFAFDYAWPAQKVALEVEGGIWKGGAHSRALHFLSDMEKYNMAAVLGWRVVRCVPDSARKDALTPTLTSPQTLQTLRSLLSPENPPR